MIYTGPIILLPTSSLWRLGMSGRFRTLCAFIAPLSEYKSILNGCTLSVRRQHQPRLTKASQLGPDYPFSADVILRKLHGSVTRR